MSIQDMDFLHGCTNPTLVVIHRDTNGRSITTKYEINLIIKNVSKLSQKNDMISEATMLIPVRSPFGGAIAIGQNWIVYWNGSYYVAIEPSIIKVCMHNFLFKKCKL